MPGWEELLGQAVSNAQQWWSGLTSPQQPEEPPPDWYNEPAGFEPEQRVEWEQARREAETQPQEAPWWEQAWQPFETAMRPAWEAFTWSGREIPPRIYGGARQFGLGMQEGLSIPDALGRMDWETAPKAYKEFQEDYPEPFPGYHGTAEMLVDPMTYAFGMGLATKLLKLAPAGRGIVQAAYKMPEAPGGVQKALGTALRWFDFPESQRQIAKGIQEMTKPTAMAEGRKFFEQATRDPSKWYELWRPTAGAVGARSEQVMSNLYNHLIRATKDPDEMAMALKGLRDMVANPEVVPKEVAAVLGEVLPKSKMGRQWSYLLSQVDPRAIDNLVLNTDEYQSLAKVASKALPATESNVVAREMARRFASRVDSVFGSGYRVNAMGKPEWVGGMFNVPEPNGWEKAIQAFKQRASSIWLGLNPGYPVQNTLDNFTRMLSGGVVETRSPAAIDALWLQKLGFMPSRIETGIIGPAEAVAQHQPKWAFGTNIANAMEQASAKMGGYNIFEATRGMMESRMDLGSTTAAQRQLVRSIISTSSPETLFPRLQQALGVPGVEDLAKALGPLHPDAPSGIITEALLTGDREALARALEESAQRLLSTRRGLAGAATAIQAAVPLSPAQVKAFGNEMAMYRTAFGDLLDGWFQATDIWAERLPSIPSYDALLAMRQRQRDFFTTWQSSTQDSVTEVSRVFQESGNQGLADTMQAAHNQLIMTNENLSRSMDTVYTEANQRFEQLRRLPRGAERDSGANLVKEWIEAQRDDLNILRQQQMQQAARMWDDIVKAAGGESQFELMVTEHLLASSQKVGGTVRGVRQPRGTGQPFDDISREVAEQYAAWAKEAAARVRGIAPKVQSTETMVGEMVSVLPPIPRGQRRLYRVEAKAGVSRGIPVPEWVETHPENVATLAARGRWWTESLDEAAWYARTEHEPGQWQLRYQDVPKKVYERFKVTALEPTDPARKFSAAGQEHEWFLPTEYATRGQIVSEPASKQTILDWAQGAGRVQLTEINAVATQAAENFRVWALHDYSSRLQIDALLSLIFPYHYWFTRTGAKMAALLMHRPQYWQWNENARKGVEEHNKGLPERLKYTIPLPVPEMFGKGEFRLNPWRMFGAYSMITDPFLPEERTKTPLGHAYGLATALGPQPYPWVQIPAALSGAVGPKEEWLGRWLPQSRPIQTLTAAAGIGGPQGVDIEGPVKDIFGLPRGDRWDPYRAQRWLREEVSGGRISERAAQQAIGTQKGPLWDRAMRAAVSRAAWPEVGGFLTRARPQLVAPEETKYYREERPAYREMMKQAQAGGGKALQQKWYEEHPGYGIWSFGRGTPEEAAADLRTTELREKLGGSRQFHLQERGSMLPWQPEYNRSKAIERASGERIKSQYQDVVGRLEQPSLRAMSRPELKQYVRDDQLRKASDAFFAADFTSDEGRTFRKQILEDNPDLKGYWAKNDTPLEAVWRVQQDRMNAEWESISPLAERAAGMGKGGSASATLWEEYWALRAAGYPSGQLSGLAEQAKAADKSTARSRAWSDYYAARAASFAKVGDAAATDLTALVMKEYPGRWTKEELNALYAGITVPGMETWRTSRQAAAGAGPGGAAPSTGLRRPVAQRPPYVPPVYFKPKYPEQPPASFTRPRRPMGRGRAAGGAAGKAPAGGRANWSEYYALPVNSPQRIEWLDANNIKTDPTRLHWDRWSRYISRIGKLGQVVLDYFKTAKEGRDAYIQAHPELASLMTMAIWPNQFRIPDTLDELLEQLEALWGKAEAYQARTTPKVSPRQFFGA